MNRRANHKELADAHREEAAALVRAASMPVEPGERISAQIARAAQRLGFAYSRTEDIWRKEARTIHSWEMDLMRAIRKAKSKTGKKKRR